MKPRPLTRRLLHVALALALAAVGLPPREVRPENWPQFRGPTGLGLSGERDLPTTWGGSIGRPGDGSGGENVLWSADLVGSGHASPIVWEDRVLVTTVRWPVGVEDRSKTIPEHHILCYGTRDGKLLWDRVLDPGPWLRSDFRSGPGGGYAASTPATDGAVLVCAFGSAVIAALDLEGRLLWREEIIPYTFDVTLGSSPILFEETAILLCAMAERADSRVIFYRKRTGEKLRETRLPGVGFGHSTPVIVELNRKPRMLFCASGAEVAPQALRCLDPRTGAILWSCPGAGDAASPAFGSGIVYFDSGRWGPGTALRAPDFVGEAKDGTGTVPNAAGRAEGGASRVEDGGEGPGPADEKVAPVLWTKGQVPEAIGSPIIVGPHVYRLHSPGILRCWKLESGEEVWAKRLEGIGTTWASPVATADGRIYCASAGKSFVLEAGAEFRVLGTGDLGDSNHASPAISGGRIFLVGAERIHAVGKR
jgi:outer membrane protein assembly factor BamB